MRTIGPEELNERFPKLVIGTYERASKATARYNCLAFAHKDERHWWEAGLYGGGYYWPEYVRQDNSLEAWIEICTSSGYETTDNWDIEPGYEKVAIYVDLDLSPTHAARSDGHVWKSKLGKGQDIDHYSLDVLEGDQKDEYGIVERVFRRLKVGGE